MVKRFKTVAAVALLLALGLPALVAPLPSWAGAIRGGASHKAGRAGGGGGAALLRSAGNGCPAAPYGVNFDAPSVPGAAKTVALTFDDGPGPSTMAILHILESFNVPATFFNVGVQEASWPSDVRAEQAAGFLVANHTWSHPDLTALTGAGQESQMEKVIAEQESLIGTAPCELRPPYGDYNSTTLHVARSLRMSVWLWNVDTEDWMADGSGSSYWVRRIIRLAETEGGALTHPVVLMHNQAIPMPATVAALPTVIGFFESHGYTFVDLLGRTTRGASAPAVSAVGTPGGEHVFWRGADGALWNSWYSDGRWHGPATLTSPGAVASAPVAVATSTTDDAMDVFFIGRSSSLWHSYYAKGRWHGPYVLVGSTSISTGDLAHAGALSAVFSPDGDENVLWAAGGAIWGEHFAGGRWAVAPVVATRSAQLGTGAWPELSSIATSASGLDVFWKGKDGSLWHTWLRRTGTWSAPAPLGGSLASAPSAVRTKVGEDVFFADRHGNLLHLYEHANRWHGPYLIALGVGSITPVGLSSPNGDEHVFWSDGEGDLVNAWLSANRWKGPAVATAGGDMAGALAAVTTGSSSIDVFSAGSLGLLWHSYLSEAGSWHGPYTVSSMG